MISDNRVDKTRACAIVVFAPDTHQNQLDNNPPMYYDEVRRSQMRRQLAELRVEHRDLDRALDLIQDGTYVDQIQVRRMKKRKLMLKDMISYLENALIPDEPA